MKKQNITATTVKLDDNLYDEFKVLGIRHRLTLQDFVDKCVHLYVSDEPHSSSFRALIDEFSVLSTSGSFVPTPLP